MTVKVDTLRKISLNQPAGASPRPVRAVQRGSGIRASDVSTAVAGKEIRVGPEEGTTGQLVGEGISALGEFARLVEQRQDEIETTRLTTEFEKQTAGLIQQTFNEVSPEKAPKHFQELHKETTERILAQTDDRDVQLQLQTVAGRHRARGLGQVLREVDKQQKTAFGNEIKSRLELKIQQRAAAETDQERAAATQEIERLIRTKAEEGIEPLTEEGIKLQTRLHVQASNALRAETAISQKQFGAANQVIENEDLNESDRAKLRSKLNTQRRVEGNKIVDEAKKAARLAVATNGRQGVDTVAAAGQQLAALGGTNEQIEELNSLVTAAKKIPGFADKTVPEQNEQLLRLSRNADSQEDLATLDILSRLQRDNLQKYKSDPLLAQAIADGVEVPSMPDPSEFENDAEFETALRDFIAGRQELARSAERKQFGEVTQTISPFTDAEIEQRTGALKDPSVNPIPHLQLLASAKDSLEPRRFTEMVGQIEADEPAFAVAVNAFSLGDQRTATKIVQGVRAMDPSNKALSLPTEEVRKSAASDVFGAAFDNELSPRAADSLMRAGIAFAVAESEDFDISEEDLKNGLAQVLAGSEASISDATAAINGHEVANPVFGSKSENVSSIAERIEVADLIRHRTDRTVGSPMFDRGDGEFRGASTEDFEQTRPLPIDFANGIFIFETSDGGFLVDENGDPYEVNLRDVILDQQVMNRGDTGAEGVSIGPTEQVQRFR